MFILYTSGSTGKPKGVLHTTRRYLFWPSWTRELVLRDAVAEAAVVGFPHGIKG